MGNIRQERSDGGPILNANEQGIWKSLNGNLVHTSRNLWPETYFIAD